MQITNTNELKKNNKIELFNCGSQRLSHEINTKLGISPIKVYEHRKSNRIINVFIMTKELSEFLKEWSRNKPTKNKGGECNG